MSELKSSLNKNLDFYLRAKKQYENAAKPFTYELNIISTQPKPKKFQIIINKFIDILKEGMKWEYADEEELKDNYWDEMEKLYAKSQYQMTYVVENSYQKKRNKLRLYFGLLLNGKKIFQVIREITTKLNFMYENPQQKLKDLDKLFQPVEFLKDGQFNIMSEFINDYERYQEDKKKQEKTKQKQAALEKKKLEQLEEKRKKELQQRLEKQLKDKEEKERIQRERVENQLKNKQKEKEKLKAMNQSTQNTQKQTEQTPQGLDDSVAFIPDTYKTQYKHDVTAELMRRRLQNKQVVDDMPPKNKNRHQKNSEILFQEKYKDEFEVFSFRLKPQMQTSSEKKQKCAECGKPLKQGFYFVGGNQNQCLYTGEWFCNEHMAEQRISIPWKAIQSFDLRGYPVSQKSYIEIKSYYEKPILQIKSDSEVVKQSKQLYDFLVLKRQIHLMYDSICDLELMQPLLKKKLNYCLKQNLFSLKNLYDIYNSHEAPSLQKEYDILSKHFYRCERCQKRKGYVCPLCKDPVKIFAFELKETHGCSHCRKLYHRKCLNQIGGKCECQEE